MNKIYPLYTGSFHSRFPGLLVRLDVDVDVPGFAFLIQTENGEYILVDTGFRAGQVPGIGSTADQKEEHLILNVLQCQGIDPLDIDSIIMTHLHWDHTAALSDFPNAHIYVQASEMNAMLYIPTDVQISYAWRDWMDALDRFILIHGDHNIGPGIDSIFTGDHSGGHQVVRIQTDAGPFVIGGDCGVPPYNGDNTSNPDGWEAFRTGIGSRFYWNEEVVPALQRCLQAQGFPIEPMQQLKPLSIEEIKSLGTVIYSHDLRLRRKNYSQLW